MYCPDWCAPKHIASHRNGVCLECFRVLKTLREYYDMSIGQKRIYLPIVSVRYIVINNYSSRPRSLVNYNRNRSSRDIFAKRITRQIHTLLAVINLRVTICIGVI